jgi:hypothetical protein
MDKLIIEKIKPSWHQNKISGLPYPKIENATIKD